MAITAGVNPTNVANKWLDGLRAQTGFTVAVLGVKLHTGNPGAACTASASSVTTRQTLTFSAASGGILTSSNTPSWTSWAGSSETISHISIWDTTSAAAGNPLWSGALSSSKYVTTNDTFTLSQVVLSITGLATDA